MIFESSPALKKGIAGVLEVSGDDVKILDAARLQSTLIDDLVATAAFSSDLEVLGAARWLIRRAGVGMGVVSSSIQTLYESMGRGEVCGFTVPAINIRGIAYHTAQAAFRAALKAGAGAVVFEIARSEIDYTRQRPSEYAAAVTAAAIKTGWRGPLFLQGDHFQISAAKYAKDSEKEIRFVKDLVWEAMEAGFYNIDLDTSTLVDLSQPTIGKQQKLNFSLAAELTTMIRDLEPEGITVSVGGEIGEVGGKNSTVEELRAYMDGYRRELDKKAGADVKGISKISVQTGTTHGGVPLPDGTIAKVKIDFDTLQVLSETARKEYGLAGAVQHGASTLPNEAFDRFPAVQTAEIHLATGFQNILYDSRHFPAALRETIYAHLKTEMASERKEKDTEEQFLYKTRKKGLGVFKKELWNLPARTLASIGAELENQFSFLFQKLNVTDTADLVCRHVQAIDVPVKRPDGLKP